MFGQYESSFVGFQPHNDVPSPGQATLGPPDFLVELIYYIPLLLIGAAIFMLTSWPLPMSSLPCSN